MQDQTYLREEFRDFKKEVQDRLKAIDDTVDTLRDSVDEKIGTVHGRVNKVVYMLVAVLVGVAGTLATVLVDKVTSNSIVLSMWELIQ